MRTIQSPVILINEVLVLTKMQPVTNNFNSSAFSDRGRDLFILFLLKRLILILSRVRGFTGG